MRNSAKLLLLGSVGVRRGRRDEETLRVRDALDFWRVELYVAGRRLRLHAAMKVPGRAWLEFEVTSSGKGSIIRQTAIFDPLGLFGILYWHVICRLHQCVFAGMLRNIARVDEGSAVSGGKIDVTVSSSGANRSVKGRS